MVAMVWLQAVILFSLIHFAQPAKQMKLNKFDRRESEMCRFRGKKPKECLPSALKLQGHPSNGIKEGKRMKPVKMDKKGQIHQRLKQTFQGIEVFKGDFIRHEAADYETQVVYFTATFPYVLITILLIRGITLDGAGDGIYYYLVPTWEKLAQIEVWKAAAIQIFYTYGVAFGVVITIASYNEYNSNVLRDAFTICVTDSSTSFYTGFAIFSTTGFIAKQLSKKVPEVVTQGTGLAFVVYAEALSRMPWGPFWSVLFFFMMILIGLDSQFPMIECPATAFMDEFPQLRKSKPLVFLVFCIIGFLLGLPMCFSGGIYIFTLINDYSAGYCLMLLSLSEALVVIYVYGFRRFKADIELMIGKKSAATWGYWMSMWMAITPIYLFVIFIYSFIDYGVSSVGDYTFPPGATVAGWVLSLLSILCIPIFALYHLIKALVNKTLECHSGPCPPCARPGQNSCPCGKQSYTDSDCVDDLPCCGDTCGKLLDCQLHECIEQCHRGLCGTCTQERLKRCRCGAKERDWQCARPLHCELKCRQKRQCGRHPCSRRCCDGNCPPCEQPCQRPLNCGRHRCQAPCHKGPCYPCTLTGDVACACGGTVLKVACGRVKHTRPPRCRLPCPAPPDCHHPAREPHRCHAAACPPCKQRCDMQLATCAHRCAAPCHGAVLTDTNAPKQQPATPWERPKARMQLVALPCPPCRHPVDVTCRGGHETAQVPCCEARQFSCGRVCARPLPCGNHSCQLECHQTSVEGSACEECEGACSLERSADCPHPCPRPCHPAPCAPCKLTLTQPCHCGLNTIYVPCNEWSAMGAEERRAELGCGNVCPRLMECGHQCVDKCHPLDVPCAQPSRCRRRLPLKCPCARRTVKLLCPQARETKLGCDEECEKAKTNICQQLNSKSTVEKSQSADDISQQQTAGSRRKRKKKERLDESNGEGNRILKTIREKPLISVSISVAFIAAVIWVCLRNFMQ